MSAGVLQYSSLHHPLAKKFFKNFLYSDLASGPLRTSHEGAPDFGFEFAVA